MHPLQMPNTSGIFSGEAEHRLFRGQKSPNLQQTGPRVSSPSPGPLHALLFKFLFYFYRMTFSRAPCRASPPNCPPNTRPVGLLGEDLPNPNGTITTGFLRNWCFQRPGMLDTSRFPLSRAKLCPTRVLLMLRRPLSLFMKCPQAAGPCTSKISSFFRQHVTY